MKTDKDLEDVETFAVYCAYCGVKPGTTKDHVVSVGLFPPGYAANRGIDFVTVPACQECNAGFSQDEDYLRAFVAPISSDWSNEAKQVFEGPVKRQFARKPALAKYFQSKMEIVRVPGKSKEVVLFDPNSEHWERCFAAVQKSVLGTMYSTYGMRLPEGYGLNTVIGVEPVMDKISMYDCVVTQNYPGVFKAEHIRMTEGPPRIWITMYYDRIRFITIVSPIGTTSQQNTPIVQSNFIDLTTITSD